MGSPRADRAVRLPFVLGCALGALVTTASRPAVADGEVSPMIGVAVVGGDTARTPEADEPLGGVALDAAWWYGRIGLAGEASARWGLEDEGTRAYVLGASARLRVLERMMPGLIEPRDCEMGLELQAIVERTWWTGAVSDADPTAYGLGLALRFRGGGDPDGSSLLAESRFFVRVMSARWNGLEPVARTTEPGMQQAPRALTVLLGIGASFGAGTPSYVSKFRMHPFGHAILW